MLNHNTAYSKAAHKYFLKVFYNKTNNEEYKLQIWQYKIYYINIIAMKDICILKKVKKKEKLFKNTTNTLTTAKVT